VALGILLSKLTGLVREIIFAHYIGNSGIAGVFRAAFRIPNLLSNLFGEGVLSAAFITVYSKLRASGEDEEAEEVAAAVFGILAAIAGAIVALGILATPLIIDLLAPGFHGEDRIMTMRLVRILFPSAGLLVMSAWCLGVLNSHRRFLLSYTAPVAMNAAMIAGLFAGSGKTGAAAVTLLAWTCVLGSALQFLVQLPRVLQYLPGLRPSLDTSSQGVRLVIRNFGPVFVSRGVVQISAYVDQVIGSFLGPLAISSLFYGQIVGTLPISLFSMSVSAAELPALSSAIGTDQEIASALQKRIRAGLRRIAFFVIPSATAFLAIGDVLAAALFRSHLFRHSDDVLVWSVLAGSAIGLLASSLGRLYSSGFYALLDTKTPLRFALVRVSLTVVLGFLLGLWIPHWLHLDLHWSLAGLPASAGIAGWTEFILLRRGLTRRIGPVSLQPQYVAKLWACAIAAGACGYWLKLLFGFGAPRVLGLLVVAVFAMIYFGGTSLLGIEEAKQVIASLRRRLRI
jgi:putative peptidoglycan lipid II flippase